MKKVGFIGLGKMGARIAQRIICSGLLTFVYDTQQERVNDLVRKGGRGCNSVFEIVDSLEAPRVILLCLPAGKIIDDVIKDIEARLMCGDILIDLGNSFYQETQERAKRLKKRKIHFIDVGVSGGIDGAQQGACLMVGGDENVVMRLKRIFSAMSRHGSYQYLGKSGTGHLVKGYHNLIEYGYLQALAEGLESLLQVSRKEKMGIRLEDVCNIYSQGSIVESRIVQDTKKALQNDPTLKKVKGSVYGQTLKEMQKLVRLSSKLGVKMFACPAAIKARLDTQKTPSYSGKIINAARNTFGGHVDWKK